MGHNITESLTTGISEVEKIYEAASHADLDVIKLLWLKKGHSVPHLIGFDVPTSMSFGGIDPMMMDDENDAPINLEFGKLNFFPDKSGREPNRWAYVIATERNLKLMMGHFPMGWYRIQTKSYRLKVIAMAEENGLPTKYTAPRSEHVKKTVNEEKAEAKVGELLESEQDLKAQLAAARAALATAKEVGRNEVIAETLAANPKKEEKKFDDDGNELDKDGNIINEDDKKKNPKDKGSKK
jgi:hypothetical protein